MARWIEPRTTCLQDAARLRLGLALAISAALSTGCGLDLSGLPGAEAGGMGGSASTSATGGTGSVTSASSTAPCTPTGAEVCDDGVDNDCNQETDCEDPACAAGFVCVPPIPSGWRPVAFNEKSRPPCPAGAEATDLVWAPSTALACACTCTEQKAASCAMGPLGIASNGSNPCPGMPNLTLDIKGQGCVTDGLNTVNHDHAKIAPLPPTQGTCSGTPSSTMTPPVEGRSCAVAAAGAGCAGGGACVTSASASAPFLSCLEHDDVVTTCPAGFPHGYTVGTSADDTRSCSPCTCGTSATCSSPKLMVYTDQSCSSGGHELLVTGACEPVMDGGGHSYNSYRYTAKTSNAACQSITNSMPSGSLTLLEKRTICCQ
jgi:hypothetical protein